MEYRLKLKENEINQKNGIIDLLHIQLNAFEKDFKND